MKQKLQSLYKFISEDEVYEIEERIAIMIYDGGLSEDEAIKKTLQQRFKEKYLPKYLEWRIDN